MLLVLVNGVDLLQGGDGHVSDHVSALDCRVLQDVLVLVHQGSGGKGFRFSLGFLL